MNAARAYRRLKEVEEKKLANRLALLKLELAKSMKKIEETKKRTDAIRLHRSAIQQRHELKAEEMRRREDDESAHAAVNQKSRARMAILRRANARTIQDVKLTDAKRIQEERKRHRQDIEAQRDLELKRAQQVKSMVRDQREQAVEIRKQQELVKREEARKAFNERVQTEAIKSKEAEIRVSEMEREELALIKQLEAAQEAQRHAYSDLEVALTQSRQLLISDSPRSRGSVTTRSARPRRKGRPRSGSAGGSGSRSGNNSARSDRGDEIKQIELQKGDQPAAAGESSSSSSSSSSAVRSESEEEEEQKGDQEEAS